LEPRHDSKLKIEGVSPRRGLADAWHAADDFHLTRPAVSAQTRARQVSLGIALFDRIDRDATHPPFGVTFFRYVRKIDAITNELMILIV
jgi:hypothetical protein